jgi:hypothetical protein
MIRTQIQLTPEQARALKKLAAKEGKPVAELIRLSVDTLLSSKGIVDPDEQRKRAMAAAGKLQGGPQDISIEHDRYLTQAFEE